MFEVKDDLLPAPPVAPVLPVSSADDDSEAADDPLRTYLREIHEVNLLTARDERYLASRMEESVALDQVIASLRIETASEPGSLEVLSELLTRVREAMDLVEAIGQHHETEAYGELLTCPKLRRQIDGVLDQDLVQRLAMLLDWEHGDVEREIGADDIRRQLHNEHILQMEQEAKRILNPLTPPAQPPTSAETPATPAVEAAPAQPTATPPSEPPQPPRAP